MKTYKPKTIKEAVEQLQQFLECDLYTKFKPEEIMKGEVWVRDNPFKNEKDFHKYIAEHFDILYKDIERLNNIHPTKQTIQKGRGDVLNKDVDSVTAVEVKTDDKIIMTGCPDEMEELYGNDSFYAL